MSTLDQDLDLERRHVAAVRKRAERRLAECDQESQALLERGKAVAASGDADGAASLERRVQKLRARGRRYEQLVEELSAGRERLIREILLARLQGPEAGLLTGEAERNREEILRLAVTLLSAATASASSASAGSRSTTRSGRCGRRPVSPRSAPRWWTSGCR